MKRTKVVLLSTVVLAFALLAFLAAISFTNHTRTVIFSAPSRQLIQAVTVRPVPSPEPKRKLDPNSESLEKLVQISEELDGLPQEGEVSLSLFALEKTIKMLRSQITELQNLLSRNYGVLVAESIRLSAGGDTEHKIEFDRAVAELQLKITNAKVAVLEQQHALEKFAGSDSTDITRGYEKELRQRQRAVTSLEQDLADLFLSEQERIAAKDSQIASRFRAWRNERTNLELEYSAALDTLDAAEGDYRRLQKSAIENGKKKQELEAERKRVELR